VQRDKLNRSVPASGICTPPVNQEQMQEKGELAFASIDKPCIGMAELQSAARGKNLPAKDNLVEGEFQFA